MSNVHNFHIYGSVVLLRQIADRIQELIDKRRHLEVLLMNAPWKCEEDFHKAEAIVDDLDDDISRASQLLGGHIEKFEKLLGEVMPTEGQA